MDTNLVIHDILDKAEETNLIYNFYDALPADSYLKTILAGMPEYCDGQIRNDWNFSPLETIQEYVKKLNNSDVEINKLAKQIADLDKQLEESRNLWNVANKALREYREKEAALQASQEFTYNALDEKIVTLKLRDQEIIELKARLYDVMVEEARRCQE